MSVQESEFLLTLNSTHRDSLTPCTIHGFAGRPMQLTPEHFLLHPQVDAVGVKLIHGETIGAEGVRHIHRRCGVICPAGSRRRHGDDGYGEVNPALPCEMIRECRQHFVTMSWHQDYRAVVYVLPAYGAPQYRENHRTQGPLKEGFPQDRITQGNQESHGLIRLGHRQPVAWGPTDVLAPEFTPHPCLEDVPLRRSAYKIIPAFELAVRGFDDSQAQYANPFGWARLRGQNPEQPDSSMPRRHREPRASSPHGNIIQSAAPPGSASAS